MIISMPVLMLIRTKSLNAKLTETAHSCGDKGFYQMQKSQVMK